MNPNYLHQNNTEEDKERREDGQKQRKSSPISDTQTEYKLRVLIIQVG